MSVSTTDSREDGVRVIRRDEISQGAAADLVARLIAEFTHAPTGLSTLAARCLELAPGASQQAPHHESVESVISVISGEATLRWGDSLAFCCTAGPGDMVIVPAGVAYQAENASGTEALHCFLLTS